MKNIIILLVLISNTCFAQFNTDRVPTNFVYSYKCDWHLKPRCHFGDSNFYINNDGQLKYRFSNDESIAFCTGENYSYLVRKTFNTEFDAYKNILGFRFIYKLYFDDKKIYQFLKKL